MLSSYHVGNTCIIFNNISSEACGTIMNSQDRTKPERDLYSVLSPITWFCRVFGIFPLRLKGPVGKRKYSTSHILILYNVTILALSITGLFTWTKHINETMQEKWDRTIMMTSIHLELVSQALSMLAMIIVPSIITRDEFAIAIDTLSSLDTVLCELGTRPDYASDLKRNYIGLCVQISVLILLLTYQFVYQLDFNLRHPSLYAAWMFPNVIRIVSTCLFGELLSALRQRFATINKYLINMIEEKEYLSPETVSAVDCTSERLRSIAKVHGALCEVALNVTKTFGMNIIMGVVCALKILTTTMYQVISGLEDQFDIKWMQMGGYFNRAMIGFAHIIYFVAACSLTQKQANLTAKLVHKFHINECATPFNIMLRSFSLQLYHEKLGFTAAGVFSLDATLLQLIVGAVTSFLIIVIQFDTSLES